MIMIRNIAMAGTGTMYDVFETKKKCVRYEYNNMKA